MPTRLKVAIVVIVFAIAGFMLNPNSPSGAMVWGDPPEGPSPTGGQIGLLMAVSVWESLAFGLGIAFIAFGYPLLKRAGVSTGWTMAAFVAIAWGLVSWVPHTAMHVTNAHDNFSRLILIEYLFHVTLVLGAMVLARFFLAAIGAWTEAKSKQATPMVATGVTLKP